MTLDLPELCLVMLVGSSSAGKSTFAARHFLPTEVISSDHCRALICDDTENLEATGDAFDLLNFMVAKRLSRGLLTVIDATNLQQEARKPLIALARQFHVFAAAIVFDIPEEVLRARNEARPDRTLPDHVLTNHIRQLRRSKRSLRREGVRYVYVLDSDEKVQEATVVRKRLWNNRTDLHGPFDIIGDVHGCYDELHELLGSLGYAVAEARDAHGLLTPSVTPPPGRTAIFLGDLVDRGPRVLDCYRLVKAMVEAEQALCLPGNHEQKLIRYLNGRQVKQTHGLACTVAEIEALPPEARDALRQEMSRFLGSLIAHYVLDDGKLVVAHAGLREDLQGRTSGVVRSFALYGETTGETDEYGLPVRHNWAAEYRGKAMVVYGHTPTPEAEWLNHTINLDTGCVFGGKLSALRYPERELREVNAREVYADPVRPLDQAGSDCEADGYMLDLQDVMEIRSVSTRLRGNVSVPLDNRTAALEVMSRFAADPRWLIYLPPTMSPCAAAPEGELLEHPDQAFNYYRKLGVDQVVCEEKHMGSRAVVIVCRDAAAARERFGIMSGEAGICYTRTGRRFFDDVTLEVQLLDVLRDAADKTGLWDDLATSWFCLDAELMPWSAKAQRLLREQYAAVGAAARASIPAALQALRQAADRGIEVAPLLGRMAAREGMVDDFVHAYRRYCWPVSGLAELKLAPFHLLAAEGAHFLDRDHAWHMTTLARLCEARPELLHATSWRQVDLTDDADVVSATEWWTALTEAGGEGMVVKPLAFTARGSKGLVQPAIKCRGRDYLRLIYGSEYTAPGNLERLRSRGLNRKRSLAMREFALGVESLERFIRREPLRAVHACAFAILAMESEPTDPRL